MNKDQQAKAAQVAALLHKLKNSTRAVQALEHYGVDVDRLIGISNAQGPHAKVVRGAITALAEVVDFDTNQKDAVEFVKQTGIHHPHFVYDPGPLPVKGALVGKGRRKSTNKRGRGKSPQG